MELGILLECDNYQFDYEEKMREIEERRKNDDYEEEEEEEEEDNEWVCL
ncbi:hypothetical protein [Neobacillus niacini]